MEFKLNLAGLQAVLNTYVEDELTFKVYDNGIQITVDNAIDDLIELISLADDDD